MLGEARYSKITDSAQPSEIQGEDANMLIWQIQDTRKIQVTYRDGRPETWEIQKEDNNMYYEVQRMVELAQMDGGRELAAAHLEGSVMEMEVMDKVRELTGIRFGE